MAVNDQRAVFLDRDGTIIEEKEYLHRVDQVQVLPGVPAALQLLRKAGFKLFIVSQPVRGWPRVVYAG